MGEPEKQMEAREDERDRARDELRGMKIVAEDSTLRLSDALTADPRKELDLIKQQLLANETRIQELEAEIETRHESETNLLDFMTVQTKQLEQTKIALEESKLVIANLNYSGQQRPGTRFSSDHELETLRSELRLAYLKNRDLVEAEENGKRAMDDLAVVLKEVTTDANQAKEKLNFSDREIEKSRSEAAQAKFLMKSMENRYNSQLEQARNEAEEHRQGSERLRVQVDEFNVAWNDKEIMFVKCIKALEEENKRLIEDLSEARQTIESSKYEHKNLSQLLEKALNESDVAKEDARLARKENSQLKESVAEKEIISREVDELRANEASLRDEVKELKRLLETSQNGHRGEDKSSSLKKESKDVKIVAEKEEHVKIKKPVEKEPDKDAKNTTEKEVKGAKNSKDGPKEAKVLKEDPKDVRISKEDPRNPNILKEKNLKDRQSSKENLKDPIISNEKDLRDHKTPKDLIDVANSKEDTKDLKNQKDFKDAKIAKEDPKDLKNQNDTKDVKIAKEDPKNLKDQKDPKDAKIVKDDPKNLKNPKDLKDAKIAKEDPKDLKNQKDHKDAKIAKEDSEDLKNLKDSKDTKISKEDPEDSKTPKNNLKDTKIPKDPKDVKILKDDPKIPNDHKDPKIQKENNLIKLNRNSSVNHKEVVGMHNEHKPPVKKDAKPVINNVHTDDNTTNDLLKGSIFDTDSPATKSTPQHKKSHSLSFENERTTNAEDLEHDESHECEVEHEEDHHSASKSRKKPLFKRFGNMLTRKSIMRREPVE